MSYIHQSGETMFQFLKRKKKLMLMETLARSREKPDDALRELSRTMASVNSLRDTRTLKPALQHLHNQSKPESVSTTPKRVRFLDQEPRYPSRSFIQMISPHNSKSPFRKGSVPKEDSKNKIIEKENYSRKVLTGKLNNLRGILEKVVQQIKLVKDKSHVLFVELKPMLKYIDCQEERDLERQVNELKAKIKNVEILLRDLHIEEGEKSIDEFYSFAKQYLNELNSNMTTSLSRNQAAYEQEILRIKDNDLQKLEIQNQKLKKQCQLFQKRFDKLAMSSATNLEENTKVLEKEIEKNLCRVQQLETQIEQKERALSDSIKQTYILKDKVSQLQQQKKQLYAGNEKANSEFVEQCLKIKSQREQYLLHEIAVLKKQFNHDIMQLSELQNIKQWDYIEQAKNLEAERDLLRRTLEENGLHISRLEQSNISLKANAVKYKKQSECLASDMHRINEELYQHWLALKDVKILSTRLELYGKFKRIYDDLAYNEHLFL